MANGRTILKDLGLGGYGLNENLLCGVLVGRGDDRFGDVGTGQMA